MRNHHRTEALTRPAGIRAGIHQFARQDNGSMAVFSVFVFFAMLLVGGLAIDMMRHENERIRMQNTADRSVLAATMLRENVSEATPQQIVEAYFAAEGLSTQLNGRIDVDEDPDTGRTVTVVPAATVPSLFMSMIGIDDFSVVTPARATEAVGGGTQLELVMVLDVSGSMNGQGKIGAMRTAAAELATTLLAGNEDGNVALTIVPYDSWVLPPASLLNNFTNVSGSGACNDWSVWNIITNTLNQATTRRNCNADNWAQVRPYENSVNDATTALNALVARGTTSIDLGLRYGAMFFDPSLQPAISNLIANGEVDPVFEGRPYDWDTPNVMRSLILLTDGQNCCGERYGQAIQDLNTLAVCTELKARNILVYTIAFQAPTAGATLMQACASSPNHYFNADVSEIMSVFEGIGSSIQTQALRLTL
ncbi:MAG: VWA domain-containing protein [Rhodobacteraceae bacterium]|nr:VWA domain-containing protein [Paracoccaceae bacterium]